MPVRVVFVCLGNICRSPMADAVFQNMVSQAGLDGQIAVDSCGTAGWHVGEPPHPGTQREFEKHNIPYQHRARQLEQADLVRADYLVAMDADNLAGIQRLGATSAEVALLLSYAPELGLRSVPDPWYTDRFDETYQLIETACTRLLAHVREQEHL